jgi:hypothetical protein
MQTIREHAYFIGYPNTISEWGSELYRVTSTIDVDGIFYAFVDEYDFDQKQWEQGVLTSFQRDDTTFRSPSSPEITEWFGLSDYEPISAFEADAFITTY